MTSPMLEVASPSLRFLATMLRRNPRLATAVSTRSRTSARTFGSLLKTRDTVLRLTPATWATSRMVGRREPFREADIVR